MSNFDPVWQLTVDGTDYTDLTLADMTITSGRTDIYTQPVAGYCSLEILNLDKGSLPFTVNQGVAVQVKDSTGTFVPLFGGNLTDAYKTVKNAGSVTYSLSARLTALGALARLPKVTTTGVLTSDLEGNQIKSILEQLLAGQWNEVPAGETWAAYDPTTNWLNAENLGLGDIDPGQYDQIARSSSVIDIYSLVAGLAQSGFGYLFEDAEGRIGYADTIHRQDYLSANGYVEISAGTASFRTLRTKILAGDIRNKSTIYYGSSGTSISTAEDATSQALYGAAEFRVTTSLKNKADADEQAARYLSLRAYPRERFDAIEFDLTNPEIDDADRDALLGIFMGMPMKITDLPVGLGGGEFTGFVEGWTWKVGYNRLGIVINLSPTEFSIVAERWNQVSVTESWNTLSPTMTWNTALGTVA